MIVLLSACAAGPGVYAISHPRSVPLPAIVRHHGLTWSGSLSRAIDLPFAIPNLYAGKATAGEQSIRTGSRLSVVLAFDQVVASEYPVGGI